VWQQIEDVEAREVFEAVEIQGSGDVRVVLDDPPYPDPDSAMLGLSEGESGWGLEI